MITNHDLLDNLRGQVYHLQQKLIEAQDYLAAEKSACEELHKREVEYQQEIAALRARLEKAEYSQQLTQKARHDDRDRLQQKCSDWGTYWRASDAHGVNLNIGQAIELLQDALGVEVDIHTGLDAAIRERDELIRAKDPVCLQEQVKICVDELKIERDRIARLVGLLKDIRDVYRDHDGPTWDRIDAEIGEKP